MPQEIKGIVRPPFKMPVELQGQRSRLALVQAPKVKVPLLVTLFAWYCFLRALADLGFIALVKLAPDSVTAVFVSTHFNPIPPPIPPEASFLVLAVLYIMVGWRWITRDWRARWAALFISGITVVSIAYHWIADPTPVGPAPLTPPGHQSTIISFVVNLLTFCYLAFYPGVAEAFKENSGK
jgi:hypothetical protein